MNIFSLKIDDVATVNIEGLENEGCGVAKVNGMIVFIPKTLVGEKVKIRITEIKKNYARGKVINIIEPSLMRIKNDCPYYEECGGCNLRHQCDKENLKFKKEKVEIALKKIGKIKTSVDDVIPSPKNDNYRNKASFKLEKDKIGFYSSGSYQLVDIENCKLLEDDINDCLYVIRNYLKENGNHCIKEITIKRGNALGELLVNVYSLDDSDIGIVNYLRKNAKNIKTIIYNERIVLGDGYIGQIINGYMFNCSYNSFFQVNSMQTEKLYSIAVKLAKLNKNDVPANATLLMAVLSALYALSGQFNLLSDLAMFAVWSFYVLTFIGVMKLRKTHPNLNRPYKVPLYPIIPLIAIFSGLFVVLNQLLFAGAKSTMMSLGGVVITLIGLPVYSYMTKKYANTNNDIDTAA